MATPVRSSWLPDDVLTAILELARQEADSKGVFHFPAHDEDLQGIFSDLAKQQKYNLLTAFVFSNSGPRPYSPALSDSVSKLQLAGLLGRQNPDYEVIFTTPAAQGYYEAVLSKKFSEDEKNQLRNIAKEFLSRIK